MEYRCPKAKNKCVVDLEICAGRKERKHYGCATCRVPTQKKREAKARLKAQQDIVLANEIVRGAIRATKKKREWAFKVLGVTA